MDLRAGMASTPAAQRVLELQRSVTDAAAARALDRASTPSASGPTGRTSRGSCSRATPTRAWRCSAARGRARAGCTTTAARPTPSSTPRRPTSTPSRASSTATTSGWSTRASGSRGSTSRTELRHERDRSTAPTTPRCAPAPRWCTAPPRQLAAGVHRSARRPSSWSPRATATRTWWSTARCPRPTRRDQPAGGGRGRPLRPLGHLHQQQPRAGARVRPRRRGRLLVPSGERVPLSGTSMASPNVANLAGKLAALDPALTPRAAHHHHHRDRPSPIAAPFNGASPTRPPPSPACAASADGPRPRRPRDPPRPHGGNASDTRCAAAHDAVSPGRIVGRPYTPSEPHRWAQDFGR
jgi:hypothetical protein